MTETTTAVLPERIQGLVDTIESSSSMDSRAAVRLLEESGITEQDLAQWADYSHPSADSYGRAMVHDGGHYELMVMSWTDGDMSGIHDHGYTQWGAVQLLGNAEHATFELKDGLMRTTSRAVFKEGTVVPVDHDLIHQMGNVGQPNYLTLHLYGSPDRDGDVTGDARLYELDEGMIDITGGGAFFAPPAAAVCRREDGPRADFPTWLRFVTEWMRRSLTATGSLDSQQLTERESALAAKLFDRTEWDRLDGELAQIEGKEDGLSKRYRRILGRELLASAQLQERLLAAGVAGQAFAPHAARLTELLEGADPQGSPAFTEAYLGLLQEALS